MVGANAAHAALGLSPHAAVTLGSTIGGALLAVFTELTNLPLQALARRLTALENHRTQTAHDDALTLKVSLFLLTNSYAPLLYVALVQATGRVHSPLSGALEYCHDRADFASSQAEIEAAHGGGNPYCMHEMKTLLMSLVLASQLTGMLKDFAVPRVKTLWRIEHEAWGMWRRRGASPKQALWAVAREHASLHGAVARYAWLVGADAAAVRARLDALARTTVGGGEAWAAGPAGGAGAAGAAGVAEDRPSAAAVAAGTETAGAAVPQLSRVEYEAKLEPFAGVDDRYATVIRQLGYVILFAPAFPLGASICLASNLLRMRTDAFMLLKSTQRPRYAGAEDIGAWRTVLSAIGALGAVTNIGMLGLTMPQLQPLLPASAEARLLLLVLVEHAVLLGQLLLRQLVPSYPRDLSVSRALAQRGQGQGQGGGGGGSGGGRKGVARRSSAHESQPHPQPLQPKPPPPPQPGKEAAPPRAEAGWGVHVGVHGGVHGEAGLFDRASSLSREPPERTVLPPPRALPPPSSLPSVASSLSAWASAASAGIANGSAPPPLAPPGRVLASTLLHGAPKAKGLSSHALF